MLESRQQALAPPTPSVPPVTQAGGKPGSGNAGLEDSQGGSKKELDRRTTSVQLLRKRRGDGLAVMPNQNVQMLTQSRHSPRGVSAQPREGARPTPTRNSAGHQGEASCPLTCVHPAGGVGGTRDERAPLGTDHSAELSGRHSPTSFPGKGS